MPQVEIVIGGRSFEVACQDGEEHFLKSAAAMLDVEASVLTDQIGRMPEARMLLMSGLMLADKTAAFEDQVRQMEGQTAELRQQIAALEEKLANPDKVEVPVIPAHVTDTLAELAAQAEALADEIEEQSAPAAE